MKRQASVDQSESWDKRTASHDIPTILVVDDDVNMVRMMRHMLQLENFDVITACSGKEALEMLDRENPDLILLDIVMGGMDGCEVCRRIREFSQVPIIMVTARRNESEKIEGLNLGADDYITKPFSVRELTARVRSVLRRYKAPTESMASEFRCGELKIDFAAHRVFISGREICPTTTEYRLLAYLAQNAGYVLTPDTLLNKVWGEGYYGDVHLLQVTIGRLRNKLGDTPQKPAYIITRPGLGYMVPKHA
jgi:DNA-binding response OmpR family regulator